MAARKRRCRGTTRKGKPCRAAALKGKKHCRAHDPSLPDDARFGSPQQAAAAGRIGGPATRKPRVIERMRERVEEDIEKIIAPYFEAIEHAIVTATHEGQVIPSEVADLGARIKAAEALLDRVYGKPRQVTELSGPDGGAVPITSLDDPEVARAAHEFLAKLKP
jgi:hypothetical protein